jgi:trans-2-enoyl-CoA reductase
MKAKIILTIIAIFLLGMLSGGFLTVFIVKTKIQTMASSSIEEVTLSTLNDLDKDLDFTDDQREAIEIIFADSVQDLTDFRATVRGNFVQLFGGYKARVMNELDPDQQEKFEKITRQKLDLWNLEVD